jgi:AraC-like DNA-binding protein
MLSQDFEIYYYSDKIVPTVEAHTHDYYEFYLFIEGNIIMYIDGKKFVPTPGTMVIIPPNMSHYARLVDSDVPYRRFVFWVTSEFIDGLGKSSTDYLYLTNKTSDSGTFFINKFDEIQFNTIQGKVFSLIDEINSNRFGKDAKIILFVSDLILSINRFVYESQNPNIVNTDSDNLYQSIIQYIETHIDEDLSLELLSDYFHVSKFHISHIFTDTNGLSIHKYITKKRLDMCRDAILNGQDISLVSESYGFSDYSAFYRAFVKEYGTSPKKYRDNIIRNN